MNIRSKAFLALGALLASGLLADAASAGHSTRYVVKETFTTTGFDTDARGQVNALVMHRGKSHLQRLRMTFAALQPSTTYQLLASTGDDAQLLPVAVFTTTTGGRAAIQQQCHRVNERVRRTSLKRVLPDVLAPLAGVRTLAVADTNGNLVLTINLHDAPSLEFELTSVMKSTGTDFTAVGCFAVALHSGHWQFRLLAAGQGGEFTLLINDRSVATYPADYSGRINIGLLPSGAPSPLEIRNFALRNAQDELVLETSVP